jgi:tRNA pseudouridine synthase 10
MEDRQRSLSPFDANSVCTACLGSIQFADSFVDDVCEKLKKEDYKVDSCCLTCTLPVSILPRDHLLKVHAINTLLTQYADQEYTQDLVRIWRDMNVRDPKDFFKYLFGIKLKEKSGLHLDADASLRMTVVIGHEATCKEHLFLTRLKEPLLNVRTIRQKVVSSLKTTHACTKSLLLSRKSALLLVIQDPVL